MESFYFDAIGHVPAISVNEKVVTKVEHDFESLRPYFAWLPADVIKQTFEKTTQFARVPAVTTLKHHFKSPFPAFNIPRHSEPVATDTVFSDDPAVDNGACYAQLFVGTKTGLVDVYPMKSEKQFVNTLEDNVRERGAMSQLISDRAQVEISNKVKTILCALLIQDWQSEPGKQWQNPAERKIQDVKCITNTVMDRTASPPYLWLLCLMWVCFVLNNVTSDIINGNTPLFAATGQVNDISPLLRFSWKEPVYYKLDESSYPSETKEGRGVFVGISEHVGHAMTFKVLTDDTKKVIYHSELCSALPSNARNLRLDPLSGEDVHPFIKSSADSKISDYKSDDRKPADHADGEPTESDQSQDGPVVFDPSDLVGRTFLLPEQEDGQQHRAKIVELLEDHESKRDDNPTRIKFQCSVDNDRYEEVLTYAEMLDHISAKENNEDAVVWKFRRIVAHEGPLDKSHPSYKGSKYNVMLEWETGEVTAEPLHLIAADDPVTCAIYARDNDLLDLPGWKRFKWIAKREKMLLQMTNQAKLRSYRTAPRYM